MLSAAVGFKVFVGLFLLLSITLWGSRQSYWIIPMWIHSYCQKNNPHLVYAGLIYRPMELRVFWLKGAMISKYILCCLILDSIHAMRWWCDCVALIIEHARAMQNFCNLYLEYCKCEKEHSCFWKQCASPCIWSFHQVKKMKVHSSKLVPEEVEPDWIPNVLHGSIGLLLTSPRWSLTGWTDRRLDLSGF